MKKQLIMFIMALFLVFAMTACGGDPTPGPVDPPIEPNGDETGLFKYIKEDDLLDLSSRTARGTHGVVAAANPYASYAGYYTLQNGDSVTVKDAIIDFISDGTKNNQIYYDVLTLSTKSGVNAPNLDGTTTFSKDLYGATREDGKMTASVNNERVGVLYITICYKTSTYYQSSIVNFANCGLTFKPTE